MAGKIIAAVILISCSVVFCQHRGIISLDNITFDKVVGLNKPILVKFDKKYAYGEKEEEFKKFAMRVSAHPDFLVAEVGATDWGDRENQDLMERFNVQPDKYPAFKLFNKGKEPVDFNGKVKHEELLKFTKDITGFWFGSLRGIPVLDNLVFKFFKADSKQKHDILSQCQELLDTEAVQNKANGKMYVKIMKKVTEKGLEYVKGETERLTKMLDEKLTAKKKKSFESKLDILSLFKYAASRDEL